jgi:lysophospholipase L1-like esterase
MPLGDSITAGDAATDHSGYRKPLYDLIVAGSLTVDFVGTLSSGTGLAQPEHEGHNGYTAVRIRTEMPAWIATATPTIVLLMAGVNDLVSRPDISATDHAAVLGLLLDDIYAINAAIRILVAPVPPMTYTQALRATSAQFNAAARREVDARTALGHLVEWVPMQWQSSDQSADLIHPGDTGYSNLARAWYRSLRGYL